MTINLIAGAVCSVTLVLLQAGKQQLLGLAEETSRWQVLGSLRVDNLALGVMTVITHDTRIRVVAWYSCTSYSLVLMAGTRVLDYSTNVPTSIALMQRKLIVHWMP